MRPDCNWRKHIAVKKSWNLHRTFGGRFWIRGQQTSILGATTLSRRAQKSVKDLWLSMPITYIQKHAHCRCHTQLLCRHGFWKFVILNFCPWVYILQNLCGCKNCPKMTILGKLDFFKGTYLNQIKLKLNQLATR